MVRVLPLALIFVELQVAPSSASSYDAAVEQFAADVDQTQGSNDIREHEQVARRLEDFQRFPFDLGSDADTNEDRDAARLDLIRALLEAGDTERAEYYTGEHIRTSSLTHSNLPIDSTIQPLYESVESQLMGFGYGKLYIPACTKADPCEMVTVNEVEIDYEPGYELTPGEWRVAYQQNNEDFGVFVVTVTGGETTTVPEPIPVGVHDSAEDEKWGSGGGSGNGSGSQNTPGLDLDVSPPTNSSKLTLGFTVATILGLGGSIAMTSLGGIAANSWNKQWDQALVVVGVAPSDLQKFESCSHHFEDVRDVGGFLVAGFGIAATTSLVIHLMMRKRRLPPGMGSLRAGLTPKAHGGGFVAGFEF